MSYTQLFKENNIIGDLQATEKKTVLEEMIETSVERGLCAKSKKKSILDALLERERLGSTGLGHGIAIPHVKIDGFQGQTCLLARSKTGVDFSAVDGEPVYIFFLLISSSIDATEHLSILQWISRMARHQDFTSFVKNAKDVKEILSIIKEFGG
ncbi:MAG: PTS sugar transporter subunit IIA [Planctomycetes bacterium]|nr:PTS sugar transporter subunit IIA [Planctomycetota bacterium]